jgi:hypothetical protein
VPTLISPTFPIPKQAPVRSQPIPFPPAPLFDFELGDHVRDYTGAMVMADGYTAWQQWCLKALQTQQTAYPIYPRNHGIHLAVLKNSWPRAVAEADLRHRIYYTLTRSRRTLRVDNFVFDWSVAGTCSVSCVPVPVRGAPFVIVTKFNFA